MDIVYFYEKVPSSLDTTGFFQNVFTATPSAALTWFSLANNIMEIGFTRKACKFAIKRDSSLIKFLKLAKEKNAFNKTPYANFIFPTQSKSSDRVFFTKIKDHNYVLLIWYFSQFSQFLTRRTTSMDKSILSNIAILHIAILRKQYCYQNRNPSQTFLWG